jgi:hypothetical protein
MNSLLDNVSVSDCSSKWNGGGLKAEWSPNLTIRDCRIVNNTVSNVSQMSHDILSGGGMYLFDSSVNITGNTQVCNNTVNSSGSASYGGGIDSNASALTISGSANISNNSVIGSGIAESIRGGGIYANFTSYSPSDSGIVALSLDIKDNAVISNNKANGGGGIAVNYNQSLGRNYVVNITGEVEISNNTAERTDAFKGDNSTGGGIMSFVPVNISGKVIIQGNKAIDTSSAPFHSSGGGIFMQDTLVISDQVQILDNEAHFGGGLLSFNPAELKGRVLVSGNKGYQGGGLYFMNNSVISDKVTVSQNDAYDIGAGICLSNSVTTISDNVLIAGNRAGKGSQDSWGLGGGIYMDRSTLTLSDNVLLSENKARNGGGIAAWMHSKINLMNNTLLVANYAAYHNPESSEYPSGLGGGIFTYYNSTVTVSGAVKETVSGTERDLVMFFRNGAADSGGAVCFFVDHMNILNEYYTGVYTGFKKTTDESILGFSENYAQKGYLWNLTDSDLGPVMTHVRDNLPLLKTTVATEPFSNVYNNFDINFVDNGTEVLAAVVTVNYYTDSVADANLLASEAFISYEGAEITEAGITQKFGEGWQDFYRPEGYKAGKLQETLPVTVDEDTVLHVVYLPNESNSSGGSGSGGSGSGSVTVADPAVSDPVIEPEVPVPLPVQSGYEAEPSAKASIIFFFAVAIACCLFVARRESEEENS